MRINSKFSQLKSIAFLRIDIFLSVTLRSLFPVVPESPSWKSMYSIQRDTFLGSFLSLLLKSSWHFLIRDSENMNSVSFSVVSGLIFLFLIGTVVEKSSLLPKLESSTTTLLAFLMVGLDNDSSFFFLPLACSGADLNEVNYIVLKC